MNIFYLDDDLKQCAQMHVDRHVVKMITEHAQLLSGAVRLSGIDAGYKLTHKNHPCAIWVRESLDNWLWLKELTIELNTEYIYRYDKNCNHKSFDVMMSLPTPNITSIGITPFRLAMPEDVQVEDVVTSYRAYYIKYKQHIAAWKKRGMPEWYIKD